MTTITVNTPVRIAAPRGSRIAALWFGRLLTRLGDLAEQRAASRSLAIRVKEANEVREFAHRIAREDARFAADLFAAADRHEQA